MKAKVPLLLCQVYDQLRCVSHDTEPPQRFLGRAKDYWDQFDEYDSQRLHCVKQTSEKNGPSLGENKSFALRILWNLARLVKS